MGSFAGTTFIYISFFVYLLRMLLQKGQENDDIFFLYHGNVILLLIVQTKLFE